MRRDAKRLLALTSRHLVLGALLVLAAALFEPVHAAPRTTTVANETLGNVTLLAPQAEPTVFALMISDEDGLTAERLAEAETLVSRGAAVALIDLRVLTAKLANPSNDDDCNDMFGDFEDIARSGERLLGMTSWRWPVMLGIGKGGTIAYIATAQAPVNTAAGAVSLGFTPDFPSKLKFCAGAPVTGHAAGAFTYEPVTEFPGRWILISPTPLEASIAPFATASAGTTVEVVTGGEKELFKAAADAVFDIGAPPAGPLSDLPLVELPGAGPAKGLAIFISGDGGWRDIDRQIGEYLAAHGVAIVGVDSLRYFWSRKEPGQIAADLDRIIGHYTRKWQVQRVGLLGYSFGADVLPVGWKSLSPASQDAVRTIALLGLEPTAELQISVTGFLGMSSSAELDVRPYLASLPKRKVMCFYGSDEQRDGDTACTYAELDGATLIERPGGHHFDGEYEPVAKLILERLTAAAGSRAR